MTPERARELRGHATISQSMVPFKLVQGLASDLIEALDEIERLRGWLERIDMTPEPPEPHAALTRYGEMRTAAAMALRGEAVTL